MTYRKRLSRIEEALRGQDEDLPTITPDMTAKEAASIYLREVRRPFLPAKRIDADCSPEEAARQYRLHCG